MAARTAKRRAFVTRPGVRSWRAASETVAGPPPRPTQAQRCWSSLQACHELQRAGPEFTRARTNRRSVHSATAPVNAVNGLCTRRASRCAILLRNGDLAYPPRPPR